VLFVIDLETRRVQIAGVVRQPDGVWMKQVARNLNDKVDGFLRGKRHLIHDRSCTTPRPTRVALGAWSRVAATPRAAVVQPQF
jgi:hypothetical protein